VSGQFEPEKDPLPDKPGGGRRGLTDIGVGLGMPAKFHKCFGKKKRGVGEKRRRGKGERSSERMRTISSMMDLHQVAGYGKRVSGG